MAHALPLCGCLAELLPSVAAPVQPDVLARHFSANQNQKDPNHGGSCDGLSCSHTMITICGEPSCPHRTRHGRPKHNLLVSIMQLKAPGSCCYSHQTSNVGHEVLHQSLSDKMCTHIGDWDELIRKIRKMNLYVPSHGILAALKY